MMKYTKDLLMLIDGHGLSYRAFYAMPNLENSNKEKVGAVYGFLNMLLKLFEDFSPEFAAVSFDKERSEERLNLYSDYKANRQKTPEDLLSQFANIEKLLEILGIPIEIEKGHEADDCIATLAVDAEKNGKKVLIVTGDKDFLQIISPNIKIVYPQKGFANFKIYDEKAVFEEFGFEPKFISDYKALAGDASDNIPGAAGIGDITAKKIVSDYGNIDTLFENLKDLKPRLQNLVNESKEKILLSKKLAVIKTDLNLKFDDVSMKVNDFTNEKLLDFLRQMEFKTVIKKVFKEIDLQENKISESLPVNADDLSVFCNEYNRVFHSIFTSEGHSFKLTGSSAADKKLLEDFLKSAQGKRICGFDLKPLFKQFMLFNIEIPDRYFDAGLANYVLSPEELSDDFTRVYSRLSKNAGSFKEPDSFEKAKMTAQMPIILENNLKENGLYDVFYHQEQPLIEVLARLENAGIYCDRKELFEVSDLFSKKLSVLEDKIYEAAGEKFNINSPKQLSYILFEKLKLPSGKNRSTNHEVLVFLSPYSPIISLILDYRELKKLLSTYTEKLPELVNPQTFRIHTNLSSRKTSTGRLSSSEPNLQNIPTRTDYGRLIRRTFKPQKDNYIFVSADYSQIELRLMAHFSNDNKMIEAFYKSLDIHTMTAAELFSVETSEVTDNMRRKAKEINFGILYGMSAHGLSSRISVSVKEAKTYIEQYFNRFPDVKKLISLLLAEAGDKGFVTTIMGRKRFLPDINSKNMNIKKASERMAVNTVIQGSAADIIKLAMIKADRLISNSGISAKMILQIHDELLFELPNSELEFLVNIIKDSMENIIELKVPLTINIEKGKNWSEMELV